jgi:hypothetical protein
MKYWLFTLLFFQFSIILGQSNQQIVFFNDINAVEALDTIELKYKVHFSYLTNLFKEKKVTLPKKEYTLNEILEVLTVELNISFTKINTGYYYIKKEAVFLLEEVVLINFLTKGFTKKKDASFEIDSQESGLLPGLTEPDILEQLQQLPSILSLDDKASEFSVRGGVPDGNRVIWDNINVYQTGHLFGMIAALNPHSPKSIHFYYKGTPAHFGERISSVSDIQSQVKWDNKRKVVLGLNGVSIDALLISPLVKNKLQVQIAIRRSYADLIKTPTFQKIEEKVFQNTTITNANFHFLDASVVLNFKPNKNNHFSLSAIHIDNALRGKTVSDVAIYKDTITISNNGISLSWNKKWKEKNTLKTILSYSHYNLDYAHLRLNDITVLSNYNKKNTIKDILFSTIYSRVLNTKNSFDIGYQSSSKEVYFSFDRNSMFNDFNNTKLYTYVGFGNYNFTNTKGFDLQLGLRTNYYTLADAWRLEPRLVINKKLNNSINYQFTGEIKNQILTQLDETVYTDLSLDTKLWHLNDGMRYPLLNSKQLTSGLTYDKNNWSADVDFYWKKTTGLAALALGYLNPTDPNIHLGDKKTLGASLYIKKSSKAFDYWLTYAYLNSQTKFEGLNNEEYFDSNDEVKHSFNTAISYKYKAFNAILGWKFASGRPVSSYEIDSAGTINFNGINTNRLPSFHRLDLSANYHFTLIHKTNTKAKIGVSLRNIYNNKSLIGLVFTGNNTTRETVKVVEKYAIGFMPNFSFRVYL